MSVLLEIHLGTRLIKVLYVLVLAALPHDWTVHVANRNLPAWSTVQVGALNGQSRAPWHWAASWIEACDMWIDVIELIISIWPGLPVDLITPRVRVVHSDYNVTIHSGFSSGSYANNSGKKVKGHPKYHGNRGGRRKFYLGKYIDPNEGEALRRGV